MSRDKLQTAILIGFVIQCLIWAIGAFFFVFGVAAFINWSVTR